MSNVFDFVVRHGEIFVFLYVFADQVGMPVPAVPALLAMGALAAVGKISFGVALALCVAASLLADFIWYGLGRTGPPPLRDGRRRSCPSRSRAGRRRRPA